MRERQLFEPKNLREKLAQHSYKTTPQRKEILQVFADNSGKSHLSAEDVYEILKEKNFDFGLATIYRNVELLNELGILTKVDFGDGCARYELAEINPNVHNHHHLICLKCKKIIEFEEDFLDALEDFIAEKFDFQTVNHEVKLFGYCSDCKGKI